MSTQTRIVLAALMASCIAVAAGLWWLCMRSAGVSFLPAAGGAEWIVYPKPAEVTIRRAQPMCGVFERSFSLASVPSAARFSYRAFRTAGIFINGRSVATLAPEDWKAPRTVEVAPLLQAGTNLISVRVTNSLGPPALWLRLDAGVTVATDSSWQTSLAGAAWQNARPARVPPEIGPGNPLYGGERTLDSLKRVWRTLALLAAASLAVTLLLPKVKAGLLSCLLPSFVRRLNPTSVVLSLIVFARAVLFIHDVPRLPGDMGFDAPYHLEYVRYIEQRHELPLPGEGWEMHHPPLYYLVGAALLGAAGYNADEEGTGVYLVKAINGGAGLIHCWLALLCLRLLFPAEPAIQIVGLLVASFLPPHIYLCGYITNEPLAAMFVTLALYCYLRTLNSEAIWFWIGTGVAVGAAVLTKFSAVLAMPCLVVGLFFRPRPEPGSKFPLPAAQVLAMTLGCVAICGWHYVRIWIRSGSPFPADWGAGARLWQDPGFRTGSFYFRFGEALRRPLFSAFHSFGDGVYSTLWGDGLMSGQMRVDLRPPWHYDLMMAGYLLAAILSVMFVAGMAVAIMRFIQRPSAEWFAVLSLIAGYGLALVCLSLFAPTHAVVKAFYGLPAFVPFCAVLGQGWSWLAQRSRAFRSFLWVLVLTWTGCMCGVFWIRSSDPQVWLARGRYGLEHNHAAEGMEDLRLALRMDEAARHSGKRGLTEAGLAEAHFGLGATLDWKGSKAEAIREYRVTLGLDAAFDAAFNNLAWLLSTCRDDALRNGPEAVRLAEHACQLTEDRVTPYIGTLAAAYAEAGRFDEAVATAQRAVECARLRGQDQLAQLNQQLMELYRAHKPLRVD